MKLSASDVVSAAARKTQFGAWEVDIRLTSAGAAKWDGVARVSFHQLLAIEQGGRVISVPLMQPAQSTFSSFDGAMQVSGALTKQEATSLALAAKARS
jgi:preprotein translocase subunit SecD